MPPFARRLMAVAAATLAVAAALAATGHWIAAALAAAAVPYLPQPREPERED